MLRDSDIRSALRLHLTAEHQADTLLVDEMGLLQGAARVDLAVVNGSISGYEIKSEADRLSRLARQRDAYGMVLDRITLVTCRQHVAAARKVIPDWWGIMVATTQNGTVSLRTQRRPRYNRQVQGPAVARLLWRDEALKVLERRGLIHGLRSRPNSVLWAVLARELSRAELSAEVRLAIRGRSGWRPGL